jgi:hypothetical protein
MARTRKSDAPSEAQMAADGRIIGNVKDIVDGVLERYPLDPELKMARRLLAEFRPATSHPVAPAKAPKTQPIQEGGGAAKKPASRRQGLPPTSVSNIADAPRPSFRDEAVEKS